MSVKIFLFIEFESVSKSTQEIAFRRFYHVRHKIPEYMHR